MFLKSLLLSVRKKVGEPILIFLSVALAVAVFLSAVALRESIEKEAIASYRFLSGKAEIEASLSPDLDLYYLTDSSAEFQRLKESADSVGELYAGFFFYASCEGAKKAFTRSYATDFSSLGSYNPVSCLSGEVPTGRTGAVISRAFADKIGAAVGSEILLSRYGSGQKIALTVSGIAEEKGVFASADLVLSERAAGRLFSLGDGATIYNRFFLDYSDEKLRTAGEGERSATERIGRENPSFSLSSPVNEENVGVTLAYQGTLIGVIAALVAVIGAVFIYTAVTLVLKNRIGLASLFMTAGATKGQLFFYLAAEILLYGLLGSIAGVFLSFGISRLFALAGSFASGVIRPSFALVALSVLFGVLLSFLSSLIPLLRLTRTSLYDALHFSSPVSKIGLYPSIVSFLILLLFTAATALVPSSLSFGFGVVAFGAAFAFVFFAAPLCVKGANALIMRAVKDGKAGILYVASSGAKEQKHSFAGARILAVASMAVIVVSLLSGEAASQLRAFEKLFKTEIVMTAPSGTASSLLGSVRQEDQVENAYLAYLENKCAVGEGKNTVTFIAVRAQEAEEALDLSVFGLSPSAIAGERKIAISRGLAMKLGVSEGKTLSIRLNGEFEEFAVSYLMDTPLTLAFADLSGLSIGANACLVKGKDPALFEALSEKYSTVSVSAKTRDVFSYVISLADSYLRVFRVLSILVALFAAAGYVNAYLASLRDRKKEFDVLAAAGAGKKEIAKILALENTVVLLSALALGFLLSAGLLFIVQNMLKTLGLYFSLIG